MLIKAPLFLTNKNYYKKVKNDFVTIEDGEEFYDYHYEVSKKVPNDVKVSYIEYCKERNLEPIFY